MNRSSENLSRSSSLSSISISDFDQKSSSAYFTAEKCVVSLDLSNMRDSEKLRSKFVICGLRPAGKSDAGGKSSSLDFYTSAAIEIQNAHSYTNEESHKSVSWRCVQNESFADDAAPNSYMRSPRKLMEAISFPEPNFFISVHPDGSPFYNIVIEFSVHKSAFLTWNNLFASHNPKIIPWLPLCFSFKSPFYQLAIHGADNFFQSPILLGSTNVKLVAEDFGQAASIDPTLSDSEDFQFIIFSSKDFVPTPINANSTVWLPSHVDSFSRKHTESYSSKRLKPVFEYIENVSGFFNWYFPQTQYVFNSLSRDIVFIPQCLPFSNDLLSFDFIASSKLVILPTDLICDERDIKSFYRLRHLIAQALFTSVIFKACPQLSFDVWKRHGYCPLNDAIVLESLSLFLTLSFLRVYQGDCDFKWSQWKLSQAIRSCIFSSDIGEFTFSSQYVTSRITLALFSLSEKASTSSHTEVPLGAELARQLLTSALFETYSISNSLTHALIEALDKFSLLSWFASFGLKLGLASVSIRYNYNRKRMCLETDFVADQEHNSLFEQHPIKLSARLQETNGTVYEHGPFLLRFSTTQSDHRETDAIHKAPSYHCDIILHSRVRKPHSKRRRQEQISQAANSTLTSPVADSHNQQNLPAHMLPPIRWIRFDCHWQCPFVNIDVESQTLGMLCSMIIREGSGDVRAQLDGLECIIKRLSPINPQTRPESSDLESTRENLLNSLERIILEERFFWPVRCAAIDALSRIDGISSLQTSSSTIGSPLGLNRVLALLARKFGTLVSNPTPGSEASFQPSSFQSSSLQPQYSLPLRPNSYSGPIDYYLQCAFARSLGNANHLLSTSIKTACLVVQVTADFLRFNDNGLVDELISDSSWISSCLYGLGVSVDGLLNKVESALQGIYLTRLKSQQERESLKSRTLDEDPDFFEKLGRSASPSALSSRATSSSSLMSGASLTSNFSAGKAQSQHNIEWMPILRCLRQVAEQVERYVSREHFIPTHQNETIQAAIQGPWKVLIHHAHKLSSLFESGPTSDSNLYPSEASALKDFLINSANSIIGLIQRYSESRNFWRVRFASYKVLIEAKGRFKRIISVDELLQFPPALIYELFSWLSSDFSVKECPFNWTQLNQLACATVGNCPIQICIAKIVRRWFSEYISPQDSLVAPIKLTLPTAVGLEEAKSSSCPQDETPALPRVKISIPLANPSIQTQEIVPQPAQPLKLQLKVPGPESSLSTAPSPPKMKLRLNVGSLQPPSNTTGKLYQDPVEYDILLKRLDPKIYELVHVQKSTEYPLYRIFHRRERVEKIKAAADASSLSRRLSKARDEGKEFRINSNISPHDLQIKLSQAKDLLLRGYRIKFFIQSKKKLASSCRSADDLCRIIDDFFLASNVSVDKVEPITVSGTILSFAILLK